VIEALVEGSKPSTKAAVKALTDLSGTRRQLIILEREDALTWLSLRNVAGAHILAVDQLNTYDVLLSDDVVFTKGAYEAFVSGSAPVSATGPATTADASYEEYTPDSDAEEDQE
jgi:large subunit ribosomal protein L4